jgi:hypothetical protein
MTGAAGAHPNPNLTGTLRVSAAALGPAWGWAGPVSVREGKTRSWGWRVARSTVTGVKDGQRRAVTLTGTQFRNACKLKSTRFHLGP